jgi:type II secretion system protein H
MCIPSAISLRSLQQGFTLIEIMIVVILIGIMTAMILPEMRGTFQDALLRSTGRKMVEVLNLANSRAVSLNQAHKVVFDRKAHRYTIEQSAHTQDDRGGSVAMRDIAGGDGEIDPSLTVEVQKAEVEPAELGDDAPPTVSEDAAMADRRRDVIAFYADGTADATELVLRDRDGFQLILRINPITARVQVMEREHK